MQWDTDTSTIEVAPVTLSSGAFTVIENTLEVVPLAFSAVPRTRPDPVALPAFSDDEPDLDRDTGEWISPIRPAAQPRGLGARAAIVVTAPLRRSRLR